MKRLKLFISQTLLLLFSISLFVTPAFAGNPNIGTSGGGSGGDYVGSGTSYDRPYTLQYCWYWPSFDSSSTDVIADIKQFSCIDTESTNIDQAFDGRYLTNDVLNAIPYRGRRQGRFVPYKSNGYKIGVWGMFRFDINNTENSLPPEWWDRAYQQGYDWTYGYYEGADGGWYTSLWWWNDDKPLDAIWLTYFKRHIYTVKEVLDYHQDNHKTYLDNRDKEGSESGCKWLSECGITQSEYDYTTNPLQKSDSNIERGRAVSILIDREETCHYDKAGNVIVDSYVYHYSLAGSSDFQKSFLYNTKVPTIEQEKYRPFNLNRNDYATEEDIASFGNPSNRGLEGKVNNLQNITDNSPLHALDINSDTPFTLNFDNDSFGLRSDYNWDNQPKALENGNYERVRSEGSGSYANGKDDTADSDGRLRYYLNFYGSISNNKENPAIDSASLKNQKTEYPASKEIHKTVTDKWHGGDFVARFTYIDGYNTDNETVKYFPNWWATTYHEGRFYEYGTHYKGLITLSGVQNPSWCLNQVTATDPTVTISCDADRNDRGVYIDLKECFFSQPILYGKWDVKTVAGSVN